MAVLPSGAAALTSGPDQKHHRTKPTRKFQRRGICSYRNYTVEEASRLVGCSKGTLRRWIKSGALAALTDQKPNLILGGDLADYLKARAASGPKLKPHECYCFKCRAPRTPALRMADYAPLTEATGNLGALCGVCGSMMHKAVSFAALAAVAGILDVIVQHGNARLVDMPQSSLNDHLQAEPKTDA